ncbi:MAG: HlyD family secretion protein [Gemmatimonadota bacterium]
MSTTMNPRTERAQDRTAVAPPVPPADPAVQDDAPTGKRRYILLGVLALAVIVGAIWGWRVLQYKRTHETTDNAQIEGHVVPVIPKVGGFIARVYVADNQVVRAGDTLVTLDASDYQAKLSQALADAAANRVAAGGGARAAVAQAEAQRAALGADTIAALAVYERTRNDADRFRSLAQRNVISQQQLEAAETAFRSATADLAAARSRATASEAAVETAGANGQNASAKLLSSEAAVQTARLQLGYTVITAPTNGRVARRTAEPGQLVQPGQMLMSLVDDENVWVVANLKETQLEKVRVGQPVEIKVDAYGDHVFRGRVESIQGATGARFSLLPPDNATGNFTKVVQRVPAKIVLDPATTGGFPLRPGLSVEAAIVTSGAPSAAQ